MTDNESHNRKLVAADYVDSEGSIVRSGINLAEAVLSALKASDTIVVSMVGLPGTPSSYFNVFLRRVAEATGLGLLRSNVRFEFTSKLQEMIYERSLHAVTHHRGARTTDVDEQPDQCDVPDSDAPSRPDRTHKESTSFWRRIFPSRST